MLESSTKVAPLRGLAPYVGGKRMLAANIVKIIEATPHRSYIEPFVGMGGVFFRRRERARSEVINDLSGDVAALFRVLQRHYLAFVEMLRWQLTTRAEFERLVATRPETLTDLERAARMFYLQKTAFGGKVAGRNFGVSAGQPGAFDVTRIVPELEAYHLRLAGVVIERLPFDQIIRRYDRPDAFFFVDPPYIGSEHYYGEGMFVPADFAALTALLRGLKGRFLMTINDCSTAREMLSHFHVKSVPVSYSVARGDRMTARRELLVQPKG